MKQRKVFLFAGSRENWREVFCAKTSFQLTFLSLHFLPIQCLLLSELKMTVSCFRTVVCVCTLLAYHSWAQNLITFPFCRVSEKNSFSSQFVFTVLGRNRTRNSFLVRWSRQHRGHRRQHTREKKKERMEEWKEKGFFLLLLQSFYGMAAFEASTISSSWPSFLSLSFHSPLFSFSKWDQSISVTRPENTHTRAHIDRDLCDPNNTLYWLLKRRRKERTENKKKVSQARKPFFKPLSWQFFSRFTFFPFVTFDFVRRRCSKKQKKNISPIIFFAAIRTRSGILKATAGLIKTNNVAALSPRRRIKLKRRVDRFRFGPRTKAKAEIFALLSQRSHEENAH